MATPAFRSAAGWMVLAALANKVITFLGQLIIVNFLAPERFGEIAPVVAIGSICANLGGSGVRMYLVAQHSVDEHHEREGQTISQWSAVISACAIVGIGVIYAKVYNNWHFIAYFCIFSVYPLIDGASMVQMARLHRAMRFKLVGAITACGAIAGTITMVMAAMADWGSLSLLAGWPVNALVQFVLVQHTAGPLPHHGAWSWAMARSAMLYQGANGTNMLVSSTPVILAGFWVSPDILGAYQWSTSVSMQTVFLVSANLQPVFTADLSLMRQANKLQHKFRQILNRTIIIGLAIALLQSILFPFLLVRILPSRWSNVGEMILWASAAAALAPAASFCRAALTAIEKPWTILCIDALCFMVTAAIVTTVIFLCDSRYYPLAATSAMLTTGIIMMIGTHLSILQYHIITKCLDA